MTTAVTFFASAGEEAKRRQRVSRMLLTKLNSMLVMLVTSLSLENAKPLDQVRCDSHSQLAQALLTRRRADSHFPVALHWPWRFKDVGALEISS